MWKYRGQKRPSFAPAPGAGQESVWDYPRPPKIVAETRRVEVVLNGQRIADSSRTVRVLETASPPTFYIPPADVDTSLLEPASGASFCEWKGCAHYWRSAVPGSSDAALGWCYPKPQTPFHSIAGYFSFYPGRVRCLVDGERVDAQPGGIYGGWITSEIVGPFKGSSGTSHW